MNRLLKMLRRTLVVTLVLLAVIPAADATAEDTVKGYAEFRYGDILIVEGQRVRAHAGTRFKGGGINGLDSIPLGYEVEAKGERDDDGVIVAREIKSKPNGAAMFEGDVLAATNEIEQVWVREGRMFEPDEEGNKKTIGRLLRDGPYVRRVERIMRQLTPPYVDYDEQVRVHVVETEEWNAAAMGNGAIWVYTGLMDSMSDDELALVLGHELGHYTHEHSRRQAKSSMWQGILGMGAMVGASAIGSDAGSTAAMVAAGLGMTVWGSGYSRDLEDQADRVGLRYAAEGGFDVGAGPSLWGKFRQRYGESDTVVNFFFGSHSRPSDRIRNIERELELNYPDAEVSSSVSFGDVVAARPEPSPPASETSDWTRQVEAQLDDFGRELGREFTEASGPMIDELRAGASSSYEFPVRRGVEYVITGACDSDCDDLDLFGYDEQGDGIIRDIEPDAQPVLHFRARRSGTWTIRTTMENCVAQTCVFGIQAFER